VGGDQASDDAEDSGAVYVFERAFDAWSQKAYIKASNTSQGDLFGASVSLSTDGLTLAVYGGDGANNSGAVYVFTRDTNKWAQQAHIKAANAGADDDFGFSTALSADGNLLAVGAPREDGDAVGLNGDQSSNAMPDSGAVYLFRRTDANWAEAAYLKALNVGERDRFGAAVSLSSDGAVLTVGAEHEDSLSSNPNDNEAVLAAGAVYMY
jgi:hypothetical protein